MNCNSNTKCQGSNIRWCVPTSSWRPAWMNSNLVLKMASAKILLWWVRTRGGGTDVAVTSSNPCLKVGLGKGIYWMSWNLYLKVASAVISWVQNCTWRWPRKRSCFDYSEPVASEQMLLWRVQTSTWSWPWNRYWLDEFKLLPVVGLGIGIDLISSNVYLWPWNIFWFDQFKLLPEGGLGIGINLISSNFYLKVALE
jgi:hypothetical protein